MATTTRYLYLTRHGEASEDETTLTESGRRQAVLLGERLRNTPLSAIYHGPLPRAEQTARLIGAQRGDTPLHQSELAGDYIPHLLKKDELPPDSADAMLTFLALVPEEERTRGPALA